MKLRNRILTIVTVSFLCMIGLLYTTSQLILLQSFNELETQNARREIERALGAFSGELSDLEVILYDWAAWDDTYNFVTDSNEYYVRSNLVDQTFISLRLNLMVFVNSAGSIVYGKMFDLENEKETTIPQSLSDQLLPDSLLLRHSSAQSRVTGIVVLPEGTMLIASQPITTSEPTGEIRGTLVMGRFLDPGTWGESSMEKDHAATSTQYREKTAPPSQS